jgi:RNA polymerase sigma-70 factor, ECF subfamily
MTIDDVYREERPRALATLIRLLGDFDLAEDALQDAFAVALQQWPGAGPPDNPRAWLVATARHKAIDRLRRDKTLAAKQAQIAHLSPAAVLAADLT